MKAIILIAIAGFLFIKAVQYETGMSKYGLPNGIVALITFVVLFFVYNFICFCFGIRGPI
ncbi:MAG: hypothetical protein KBT47_04550 [Armatimonadetes bacterium]|nr:hypothetical protein [Candidatus Hippobium faecium]